MAYVVWLVGWLVCEFYGISTFMWFGLGNQMYKGRNWQTKFQVLEYNKSGAYKIDIPWKSGRVWRDSWCLAFQTRNWICKLSMKHTVSKQMVEWYQVLLFNTNYSFICIQSNCSKYYYVIPVILFCIQLNGFKYSTLIVTQLNGS